MALFLIEDIYNQKDNFKDTPQKILNYLERNKIKPFKRGTKSQCTAWILNKDNQSDFDKYCSTIREFLNKINSDNYEAIIHKIDTLNIKTSKELEIIIQFIIDKAIREEKYAAIYAKLSNHLAGLVVHENDKDFIFKKLLLLACQKFFIKITTQQNIRKNDSIAFICFISELYNQHILSTDTLANCFNVFINKADRNNLMVDMIITMFNIVSVCYSKHDNDKYNTTVSKLKKLCDDPKLSKRESIILAEALDIN